MKHRAQPNARFEAEEFKKSAMNNMAASGQIAEYRKRATERLTSQQKSRERKVNEAAERAKVSSQRSARSRGGGVVKESSVR